MMRAKLSTCALLLALSCPIYAAPSLPGAGMSMQAVESQHGKPVSKSAPIGKPPITRWDYGDYVVVFERSSVVSSVRVIHSGSAQSAAPAATAPVQTPAPARAPAPAPVATEPAPAPAAAEPAPAAPALPATEEAAPAAPATPAPATVEAAPANPVQEAMDKAAAEKAAQDSAPASAAPAPAEPAAPPSEGYTFDPETGRIIVK